MQDLWDIYNLLGENDEQANVGYIKRHAIAEYSFIKKFLIKAKRILYKILWNVSYKNINNDNIMISGARLGYLCDGLRHRFNIYNLETNSINNSNNYISKGIIFSPVDLQKIDLYNAYLDKDVEKLKAVYRNVKKYMQSNKIKLLIITDVSNIESKLYAYVAKELHIPVVYYEHGIMIQPLFGELHLKKYKALMKYWDYIWAWSENNRDTYIQIGLGTPENVRVVGYPYEVFKLKQKKDMVVFVGDAHESKEKYSIVNYVSEIISGHDIEFIYAKHNKEKNKNLNEGLNKNIKVVGGQLYKLLGESKIAIGVQTSAIAEAALYEVEAIQIDFPGEIEAKIKFHNAHVVNNREELKDTLLDILSGKKEKKGTDNYYLDREGNIVDKVEKEILSIIK